MHHPTDRITHTTAFVTPVMEHWLEREIAQWVHPMKDRSHDPSHHERMLLPRSYISLRLKKTTSSSLSLLVIFSSFYYYFLNTSFNYLFLLWHQHTHTSTPNVSNLLEPIYHLSRYDWLAPENRVNYHSFVLVVLIQLSRYYICVVTFFIAQIAYLLRNVMCQC